MLLFNSLVLPFDILFDIGGKDGAGIGGNGGKLFCEWSGCCCGGGGYIIGCLWL